MARTIVAIKLRVDLDRNRFPDVFFKARAASRRARFEPAAHKRWLRTFWKGQRSRVSTDELLQRDRSE